MHDAERRVAVADLPRDDAVGQVVVELRDLDALPPELAVDRVVAFDPIADLGLDPRGLQMLAHRGTDLLAARLAALELLGHLGLEGRKQQGGGRGVDDRGEILEVPLHFRHAQSVSNGRVDLERLTRDPPPRLGLHVLERQHVVQPVGELDQNHAHVAR